MNKKIRKVYYPPADKSITHRAMILSSIGTNESLLYNLLDSEDTRKTLLIFKKLGIEFEGNFNKLIVRPKQFLPNKYNLNASNSGTTARLVAGVLSSLNGQYRLTGDQSLKKRPMKRVIEPLKLMGACIKSENNDNLLPLIIEGRPLKSIDYKIPVASAQVKSSIILAALNAKGVTKIEELHKTRDHTERMINATNGKIETKDKTIEIHPKKLSKLQYEIPGDFSSASNFILLCLLHKNCKLIVKNVGLNPTRTELLSVLKKMGADITIKKSYDFIEPIGDIQVRSSKMHNIAVDLNIYPNLIDEAPILSVMAPLMEGKFTLLNAKELRVKESDRIKSVTEGLRKLGVKLDEQNDGFSLIGPQPVQSGQINTYMDHRIEMAFSTLNLLVDAEIKILNPPMVSISYPDFYNDLKEIIT